MFNPLRLFDRLSNYLFENSPAIERWWIKQSSISIWVAIPFVLLWLVGIVYAWSQPEQLLRHPVFPVIIAIGVAFLTIVVIRGNCSVIYHLHLRIKLIEDQCREKNRGDEEN